MFVLLPLILWITVAGFIVFFACVAIKRQNARLQASTTTRQTSSIQRQDAYDMSNFDEENVPPIHPPSSFPFESSNPPTPALEEERRNYLVQTIPAGVILQASGDKVVADFGEASKISTLEDDSCAICLVDYEHGEAIRRSNNCMHVFHSDCILGWLQQNNECPCCRRDFVKVEKGVDSVVAPPPVVEEEENNTRRVAHLQAMRLLLEHFEEEEGNNNQEEANHHLTNQTLENSGDSHGNSSSRNDSLFPSFLTPDERFEYVASLMDAGLVVRGCSNSPSGGTSNEQQEPILDFDGQVPMDLTPSCGICGQLYGTFDNLGRSQNPRCRHHFHLDCIVYHVLQVDNTCPRCHQQFVSCQEQFDEV